MGYDKYKDDIDAVKKILKIKTNGSTFDLL